MSCYFTSDTHLGHANIIKHAKRPFASVEEMDEALIRNWNTVVKPGDTVYHLGDFSWGATDAATYLRRLNGNIHIVFGNHDKPVRKIAHLFKSAQDLLEVSVEAQRITLCHYAMRVWNKSHHGAWQLYGHSHGSLPDNPNALSCDVGVDCWSYTPVSMAQLRRKMQSKEFKAIDHHGSKDTQERR